MNYREQDTIEERRLSELLHRVTPEPPGQVTVEDIAIRLANQNAPARRARTGAARMPDGGGGRPRRGRLMPLLAAAAVVLIAGASAGVAVTLSSHTSKTPVPRGGSTVPAAGPAPSYSAGQAPAPSYSASSGPAASGQPITSGGWGSSVVAPVAVISGTLVSGDGSLYAFSTGHLLQIDPSTGRTMHQAPSDGFPDQPPVVAGGKVWEVTNYGGAVTLAGYKLGTLAAAGSITVPAAGPVAGNPEGIVASGPDGHLYVAAGTAVVEMNPATGSVVRQFSVTGGTAASVAVAPDGARIYVGVVGGGVFRLTELSGSSGATLASTTAGGAQSGGELVATSGGAWFTTSAAMAEQVWFAPAANLPAARIVAGPAGGDQAVPTYTGGVVWIGGTKKLQCLDPATGQVRASGIVPSDDQRPEGIGDIAVADGHVYALYVNNRTGAGGVAVLTPPAACSAPA